MMQKENARPRLMGFMEPSAILLQQLSSVKVILFDAGNTLLAYRRPLRILLQDYLMQHQVIIPRERISKALETIHPRYEYLRRRCRTQEEEQQMWLDLSHELLHLLLPAYSRTLAGSLAEWFMESWRLHKVFGDVRSTLRALKEWGYRLGVVSNWEPSLPRLLERLGLAKFFEVVVSSAGEGLWKPDSRLFLAAVDRFGVAPGEVANVGDDPVRDVESAEAAGLKAILLDRFNSYPNIHALRISTLKELLLLFPGHLRKQV